MSKLKLIDNSKIDYCYEADEHYYQGTILAIRVENVFKLYQVVTAGEFSIKDIDEWGKVITYNEQLYPSTEYVEDFECDPDLDLETNLEILEYRIKDILK